MSGNRSRFDRNSGINTGMKTPLLKFTTDINPACFSGPVPFSILGPGKPALAGSWNSPGSYSPGPSAAMESVDERKNVRLRSSGGFNERESLDEDRRYRRYRDVRENRERDRGRERERDRGRERDRSPRDRDRNSERLDRSVDRSDRCADRLDRSIDRLDRPRERDWKEEVPNNTIMVRSLESSVKESDLRNEVVKFGLEPKDIRLIREKDTGASRGFAFVEFNLLSEAVRWKELTKGVLSLGGLHRPTLHYSIPKDALGSERVLLNRADWTCVKCAMSNFRRRDYCFKCNSPRELASDSHSTDGYNEVSSMPSNTLLFRNLDISTTEERVLAMLGQLTCLPIKSLRVAKHVLTNTSRGFAFVELHSTSEAAQLHDLLVAMDGNFYVDGRPVTVSYAKRSLSSMNSAANANAAVVALAAAQWSNQEEASVITPVAYNSSVNSSDTEISAESSSSQSTKMSNNELTSLGTVIVKGVSYKKYPMPDASTYQFDESSGYYYDVSTSLYYDPNSQYYYDPQKQQYLYWDSEHQTYLPAPIETSSNDHQANTDSPTTESGENDQDKLKGGKKERIDKVKIAKKIAKDMEKWAKTLNQKKENAKLGIVTNPMADVQPFFSQINDSLRFSASADAGFAVLEKRTSMSERNALMTEVMKQADSKHNLLSKERPTLVASYGDDSESDNETDSPKTDNQKKLLPFDESKLTDWTKLACLLCKRQFPSKDILIKHQQLSNLHKNNLARIKIKSGHH